MNQRWLKRQLLSYLPLLFLIIFILLAVMFLSLIQQSRKDIVRANGVFASHVEQVVDYNLQSVEKLLLNAALQNDKIKGYFDLGTENDDYYRKYEISNELDKLKVSHPFIDSIYLYRSADQTILSEKMLVPLDTHADQHFVEEQLLDPSVKRQWSGVRMHESKDYIVHTGKIVSLASKFPPPAGELGMIIINVKVKEIEQLVHELSSSADISFAEFIGKNGEVIASSSADSNGEVLHEFASSYTGWQIRTGINDGSLYFLTSRIFYMTLGLAVLLLVLGTCWIIYTARNHYKPIQTILGRILYYSSTKRDTIFQEQSVQVRDEFTFIEEAFQHLYDQVSEYEKEQEEGLSFKRRHRLSELMSGSLILNRDEWHKEMEKLKFSFSFAYLRAAIIEVDHYGVFAQKYSSRDQYLFQFVLNSVLKEIADPHGIEVWAEWLEGHRMSVLFLSEGDQQAALNDTDEILAKLVEWVQGNLDFSVTIGASGHLEDTEQLYVIHAQALSALNYKFVKGSSQLIRHTASNENHQGEVYKLLPAVRSIAYSYRIGEPRWRDELNTFFQQLIDDMYTKNDVYFLINSILYNLHREMMELSPECQQLWTNEAAPQMQQILLEMETVEETRGQMTAVLADAEQSLVVFRENRKHHALMQEVRKYIETNFSNANLSLKQLEDEFGMSGKYISFLFHEEVGVKFADYLARLRIEEAEKLLTETGDTVQDIAAQVGYTNAMTFIRGFKKHFGMTPGDYRKKG
ncbi:helix-turn-helix domain-containing protein [Paenibacillaceae bacterium]|nr:helix-turn-helix domain-containing protein [Paenibacillaceae bacterium]